MTDGGVLKTDFEDVPTTDDGQVDLDALRRKPSSTDPRDRQFCPECEIARIFRKTGAPDTRVHPEDWRCANGHHFDQPKSGDDVGALPRPFGGGRE